MSRKDIVRMQLEYLERFYAWIGWMDNLANVRKLIMVWLR